MIVNAAEKIASIVCDRRVQAVRRFDLFDELLEVGKRLSKIAELKCRANLRQA